MYSISKQIGNRIREIRKSKNIRQFELAEKIGIEPTNLSKIENGVYFPREDKLRNIIDVLNIDLKDLFDSEKTETKNEMIDNINADLLKLNENELKFFYKSLKSYIKVVKQDFS